MTDKYPELRKDNQVKMTRMKLKSSMMEQDFPYHQASLHITHNNHKAYYDSIEEYLNELNHEDGGRIAQNIIDECIEKDSIWELQVYKHTPIGFYNIYSPTFQGLFDQLEPADYRESQ